MTRGEVTKLAKVLLKAEVFWPDKVSPEAIWRTTGPETRAWFRQKARYVIDEMGWNDDPS